MEHERPPSIVHLENNTLFSLSSNTLSSLLSNTLSSLSSDTLSLSLSNNSSSSSKSGRSKTNSYDNDLFPSSSQSTENSKSYSRNKMSINQFANYGLSFCDWAMGKMSESCSDNPHQEQCVEEKNVTLHTQRMQGESAQILSIRLATATLFRGES
jgi:hypothetical protein